MSELSSDLVNYSSLWLYFPYIVIGILVIILLFIILMFSNILAIKKAFLLGEKNNNPKIEGIPKYIIIFCCSVSFCIFLGIFLYFILA